MRLSHVLALSVSFASLAACVTETPSVETAAPSAVAAATDTCGASKYQSLVGGPSSAATNLNIPDSSHHYGSEERVATDTPSRLNFVHSGTAIDSVIDPNSKVTRVFCG